MSGILDELAWRGLIAQTTDRAALGAALAAGPITYYCGFDPTAPSLHIGNLVQVLTLRRLQLAGNYPIGVVGGATGLIGDPKMTGERTLNDPDVVAGWVERIRTQIAPLLDFDGPFAATMANNLDWTRDMTAIGLLRDLGKHFRMSTMLARETVAARMASDQGLSYTEFSYQVLQAMDFMELRRRYGCTLQTGGNDQWGNLVAGVELIRRTDGVAVHALTTPLITKADGTKFGKTESGTVWLDPTMTSPYAFYQFWLNTDDRDVEHYLGVFTFRTREEISALAREVAEHPERREAARTLAGDVTALVHGEPACAAAVQASHALFGRGELAGLDASTLGAAVAGLPSVTVDEVDPLVVDLFAGAGLERGKGAARRTMAEGGLYVNNVKLSDPDARMGESDWLHGRYALLRRGRKTLAVAERRG
ncbi:MAG: tyrosine--tRNA ligase [Bifidobacteriaceae bacterium]|nr:tyrosine--tRNA ligase [Bifidobacteriaceae bacterium]